MTDLETVAAALNLAAGSLAEGTYELTRSIGAINSAARPIIAISHLDDCERQMAEAELMMREARKIIGGMDIRWLTENKAKSQPSRKPPISLPDARKPTVVHPFNAGNFGPGTQGFRGRCSHCDESATWMARIFGANGRSRMVSLCSKHSARIKNAIPEETTAEKPPADRSRV